VSVIQARQIWWDRVDRAAKRQGAAGARRKTEWSHAFMVARSAPDLDAERQHEWTKGVGWRPIPPERFEPEYIERECIRLHDELGADLGVGPYPR
jgi:hypothetical protein